MRLDIHTPAPWSYTLSATSSPCSSKGYVLDANGDRIVSIKNGRSTYTMELLRIISTAPELLSALMGAREALRRALPHLPPEAEALFCGEWLDAINEVIEKAMASAEKQAQAEYEMEIKLKPFYVDGKKRPYWHDLGEGAQQARISEIKKR